MKNYKVLFADLDGTLIDTISGETFPKGIWDMKLKFDVLDAIKKLNPELICIVTNQGGIEKGFVDRVNWVKKADYIVSCIEEYTTIGTMYEYCSTDNKHCQRRKPNVGILQHIMNLFSDKYDKFYCLMIGDASGKEGQFSDSDKKTAENFGIDYLDVADFVEKLNEITCDNCKDKNNCSQSEYVKNNCYKLSKHNK